MALNSEQKFGASVRSTLEGCWWVRFYLGTFMIQNQRCSIMFIITQCLYRMSVFLGVTQILLQVDYLC